MSFGHSQDPGLWSELVRSRDAGWDEGYGTGFTMLVGEYVGYGMVLREGIDTLL